MQFIDRTKIIVKAGDGGHGKSAFRREKFIPKGGPSGGDGGRGADVILKVDRNMNTLLDFRYHRKFVGKNGGNGDIKNQYGKNAPQCIIKVPAGTLVKDAETGEVLADLVNEGDEAIVAKGGRGGRGNAKFATSANRAPTFAELGEPGEGRTLLLELKLLADVGLVGYPSVGKSSIIASVSAARPEIADYHFTTITPVLGVVEGDSSKALYNSAWSLLPDYGTPTESTALNGVNTSTHVMLSVAQGITVTETEDVTAEPLLNSSASAYAKADINDLTTMEREEGNADGPFALAVWARNEDTGAEVLWIGCPNMDNEQLYQSMPGNLTFLQGCAASLVGQDVLVDTKALEAEPITVAGSAAAALGLTFVFVLPAAVLIAGAVVVLLRRRR